MRCRFAPLIFGLSIVSVGSAQKSATPPRTADQGFASLEPIDTHTHVFETAPAFIAMLERLHLHVLDILVVNDKNGPQTPLETQRQEALKFVSSSMGRARLCTTFDPFRFNDPNFPQEAIESVNQDFSRGAVAVKIWKNIGMELKNASGQYVMPDDPRFEPIYRDIAAHHKTLIAHLAEPDVAWGPPDPAALDAPYYAEHPEWDMSKIPGVPSKKAILKARDHLLEMNPDLRVVGAHLGSMEADVDQIADRFRLYPNFAIDTAARVPHLMIQPKNKVRSFMLKYQDRILYATDLEFRPGENVQAICKEWEEHYSLDWRYFSTNDTFEYKGHKIEGLNLPRPVLRKLYHDNALRWFPGLAQDDHRVGESYIGKGDFQAAVPYLRRAYEADPADYDNAYDLALAYLEIGSAENSRQIVAALLPRRDTAELHNLLGEIEEKEAHPQQSAEQYETAARMDPSEKNLFDLASELLLHRGFEPARKALEFATQKYPQSATLQVAVGVVYYSLGQYAAAIDALCRAVDLDPKDTRAFDFLGKMYDVAPAKANEVDSRLALFAHEYPNNAAANYYYALSLRRRTTANSSPTTDRQAQEFLIKAIELNPIWAEAHYELGLLYEDESQPDDAVHEYQLTVKLQPGFAKAHYRLARLYEKQGHPQLAQTEFQAFEVLKAKTK